MRPTLSMPGSPAVFFGLVVASLLSDRSVALDAAQDPTPAPTPVVVSLQALPGTKVLHPHPLDGSELRQDRLEHVATVRDVLLDGSGALRALVVDNVPPRFVAATRHVLPIANVRWMTEPLALLTDLDSTQIFGLPRYGVGKPRDGGGRPQATAELSFSGAELQQAALCHGPAGAVLASPAAVWLHTGEQAVALVTMAVGDEHRLLPWGAFTAMRNGDRLVLDGAAIADRIASAPSVQDLAAVPDAASRALACKHFGVPLPPERERDKSPLR